MAASKDPAALIGLCLVVIAPALITRVFADNTPTVVAMALSRMFAPEMRTGALHPVQYGAMFAVFVLGGFLTFKAYVAGGTNEEREL